VGQYILYVIAILCGFDIVSRTLVVLSYSVLFFLCIHLVQIVK